MEGNKTWMIFLLFICCTTLHGNLFSSWNTAVKSNLSTYSHIKLLGWKSEAGQKFEAVGFIRILWSFVIKSWYIPQYDVIPLCYVHEYSQINSWFQSHVRVIENKKPTCKTWLFKRSQFVRRGQMRISKHTGNDLWEETHTVSSDATGDHLSLSPFSPAVLCFALSMLCELESKQLWHWKRPKTLSSTGRPWFSLIYFLELGIPVW